MWDKHTVAGDPLSKVLFCIDHYPRKKFMFIIKSGDGGSIKSHKISHFNIVMLFSFNIQFINKKLK